MANEGDASRETTVIKPKKNGKFCTGLSRFGLVKALTRRQGYGKIPGEIAIQVLKQVGAIALKSFVE
jgi:hypothetical protein